MCVAKKLEKKRKEQNRTIKTRKRVSCSSFGVLFIVKAKNIKAKISKAQQTTTTTIKIG
jgi:hypothetical protein